MAGLQAHIFNLKMGKNLSFFSILRCPISRQPLIPMSAEEIKNLNDSIKGGEFRHLSGKPILMQIQSALSTQDKKFTYPIVDGIIVLLPAFAISSKDLTYKLDPSETDNVMNFYEELGWKKSENDNFEDAEQFEDLRPICQDYIHNCHLRINKYLSGGKYLLDAASGPVQYPEYLTYSEHFELRVCADVSFTALLAAKSKLKDKGIYVQCDITQLPFADGTIDGFVSLHTIYHVPKEKQLAAFQEFERVLSPNKSGVVVYSWGDHSAMMKILHFILRAWNFLSKRLLKMPSQTQTSGSKPPLYFYAFDYPWFRDNLAIRSQWQIKTWRSINVPVSKFFIQEYFGGKQILTTLLTLENTFPNFFGKIGQYPLLVYRKK